MTANAFTDAPSGKPTDMLAVPGLQDTTTPDKIIPGDTQLDNSFSNTFYSGAKSSTTAFATNSGPLSYLM